MTERNRHYAVLVLGDVGRSPRMQYHAVSLSSLPSTASVTLVGYGGENPIDEIVSDERIRVEALAELFNGWPRALFALWAPLKAIALCFQVIWALSFGLKHRPNAILVQNPPAIPTLFGAWFASRLMGARLIVDWHNLGFTVLSQARGWSTSHPLVVLARAFETWVGGWGDGHLCVTKAMAAWLKTNVGVEARVLYDRAPSMFRPSTAEEAHRVFAQFSDEIPPTLFSSETLGAVHSLDNGSRATVLTVAEDAEGSQARYRQDRPALIVSSTSWTPDEDFGILLEALQLLDQEMAKARAKFPDVLVCVTGKGPMKEYYLSKIASMHLEKIAIRALWLKAGDYPRLLGAADLGVCLHTSTSGLDLPMKVVDFFGAGLPVCAVSFPALPELVRHDENGLVFDDAPALSRQLARLLSGWNVSRRDAPTAILARLRSGVARTFASRWTENWNENAKTLFE